MSAPNRHSRLMMRAVTALLIGASLVSCSDAIAPIPVATAVVQRVTIAPEVDGSVGRLDALIAVEIHNPMEETLYFNACAYSLERQRDDGAWGYVWSPLCPLIAPPEGAAPGVAIPAGTTVQQNVGVWSHGSGTEWPSTGLSGMYRLRIHLIPDVDWNSQRRVARFLQEHWQATVSNEFTLSEK